MNIQATKLKISNEALIEDLQGKTFSIGIFMKATKVRVIVLKVVETRTPCKIILIDKSLND